MALIPTLSVSLLCLQWPSLCVPAQCQTCFKHAWTWAVGRMTLGLSLTTLPSKTAIWECMKYHYSKFPNKASVDRHVCQEEIFCQPFVPQRIGIFRHRHEFSYVMDAKNEIILCAVLFLLDIRVPVLWNACSIVMVCLWFIRFVGINLIGLRVIKHFIVFVCLLFLKPSN